MSAISEFIEFSTTTAAVNKGKTRKFNVAKLRIPESPGSVFSFERWELVARAENLVAAGYDNAVELDVLDQWPANGLDRASGSGTTYVEERRAS